MNKIVLSIFLLFTSIASAQEDSIVCHHFDANGVTREHTVDFKTMQLHIDFDTKAEQVNARVNYTFQPIRQYIDSLILDAPEINFTAVKLNETDIKYRTNETSIVLYFDSALTWDKEYSLQLTYNTIPKKGLYFYGWDDETNRARKQIWTQGQGIDNRYWIPSFDDVSDKLISETYITFENGYEVISNGDLISKTAKADNKTTWHYKMTEPHVVYLVMIAIGDYASKDYVSKRGVVSKQYYYPDRPQDVTPTYKYSAEVMDWMENEFGVLYPWGNIYRNVPVANFLYGAMENTTSTILTDYYLKDSRAALERDYVSTNAHELTHQWFGDYITEWNGTHHWLHESFATHYAKHFVRSITSEDEYQWERYIEMQRAFNADSRNDLPIAHSRAGSSRHYPKGSIVIDMLRDVAGGDVPYKKVITSYLKKYGFKHVDTHLFELEFMEVLGLNLNWFFDQWIYKGMFPHYEVTYEVKDEQIQIQVNQIQEQTATVGLFKMPVHFEVHFHDGSKMDFVEWIEEDSTLINKAVGDKKAAFLIFDAGNKIYNELTFNRSNDELLAQAQFATNMIDQYEALKALEEVDIKEKRKTLIEVFNNSDFYVLRANIVKQLANDKNKQSKKLVLEALEDTHLRVRRAALTEVEEIEAKTVSLYEKLLTDSSYVTISLALEKLVEQYPINLGRYLAKTEADAEKNVFLKITWLKTAIENNEGNYLNDLVDLSGKSFEFRTRIAAIRAINDLDKVNNRYIYNLLDGLIDFNRALSSTAKKTLLELAENADYKNEMLDQIKGLTFNKNEQEKIKEFLEELN